MADEAGKRVAELRGGEDGVEVLGGLEGELDAPAAGFRHRAQLARADLDESELGRDEESVGGDEAKDEDDFEDYLDGLWHQRASEGLSRRGCITKNVRRNSRRTNDFGGGEIPERQVVRNSYR